MPATPRTISPGSRDAQLLSNGRYTVVATASGSGFGRWNDLAVTRWREDPTRDAWGSYVLLSDADNGSVWSASLQPCAGNIALHAMTFSDGRAEYARRDDTSLTVLEVAVASHCDAELRRVTFVNRGPSARNILLTSYAELILGDARHDAAHPAFSKMFVQTESVDERVVLATRRRRGSDEQEVWAAHFAELEVPVPLRFEFETDRARFLGRGRTLRNALSMEHGRALSNTAGTVLDPIFSVRCHVLVAPGETVHVNFWTIIAGSRAAVLDLCSAVRPFGAGQKVLEQARSRAVAERARFEPGAESSDLSTLLLAPLLSSDAAWRAAPEALARGRGGAPVLWTRGISGDHPIVLLYVGDASHLASVRDLLRAQSRWHVQRLGVDVVVLNRASGTPGDSLQTMLETLTEEQRQKFAAVAGSARADVFAIRNDDIPDSLRDGLATVARVVLDASDPLAWRRGEIDFAQIEHGDAVTREAVPSPRVTHIEIAQKNASHNARSTGGKSQREPEVASQLEFNNGIGGFDAAAREYAITLDGIRCTPMPWINIVANPSFGFTVSAEGGGYTWSINSQQNPLTPWPNDPVSDVPREVLYLRDEQSGDVWSATALPIRVPSATYSVRHGKGYTRFAHTAFSIEHDLVQCVPPSDSIKLSRLRLRNRSSRLRRLSITAFVEWALGANGTVPAPFIVTSQDASTGALFASNRWRPEFGGRVAFADLGGMQQSLTGDRAEFLERHGDSDRPAALFQEAPLSGRVGAGLDPCAALQASIELRPGEATDIVFLLGDAESSEDARALIEKYRAADVDAILDETRAAWNDMLDVLQVRTPERAMDLLLNDWLLYQTLACRVWARTAYYQASGAYGFRDQLQDMMALCIARPQLAREHLLRAAGRQFPEGDVQHWWLPPSGQGIRTRMTDDRLWLAYVAHHYIQTTGDIGVLDETVPFLEGEPLPPDRDEAFFTPRVGNRSVSLYEHCARALDVSLSLGAHDLPLMGTGDWNDGMNRVGEKGRGESVWMGWFLLAVISALAPIAEARKDTDRVDRWRHCAATVRAALEKAGWDGEWYRRAYYDDGSPLGSSRNDECRIDAIAQSWSVISGAAGHERATRAMESLATHLVRQEDRIALLLAPPFDRTPHDPGYIKAYPPGIRENGGQYTHGSIWGIFAFAALGHGDRAGDLFAILNPVRHAATAEGVERYKVEPYVACADVYSVPPHNGRGGWTWYTGSAGWLYRAGLEAILGFRLHGDTLTIDPCIPRTWPAYQITFQRRSRENVVTRYDIAVRNPLGVNRGVVSAQPDGVEIKNATAVIPLFDDGRTHSIHIGLGRAVSKDRRV